METLAQVGAALGALVIVLGQAASYVLGRRDTRALREQFAERSLDPSEVKTLRQFAPHLHEIRELSQAVHDLRQAFHDNGLDRSELRKVRAEIIGGDGRPSGLHDIRSRLTELTLWRSQVSDQIDAMETDRRERSRRVDDSLESLRKELRADREDLRAEVRRVGAETVDSVGRTMQAITEFLESLRAKGIRGLTPPEGYSLGEQAGEGESS